MQKLKDLAKKHPSLAFAVQDSINREVLAARILVEVVLPQATGKDLEKALEDLAKGDASADPKDAIEHYKKAWKHATD